MTTDRQARLLGAAEDNSRDLPSAPVGIVGLTPAEVTARIDGGQVNNAEESSSRSIGQILRGNLLTLFNAILGACFVVMVVMGELKNALFGLVIIINAAIGVVQEYRAKRTLDRLAVLDTPRAVAVRDGASVELDIHELVTDDVLRLDMGDQIPVDGVVLVASGLEADESLLTGESDPVSKHTGDTVMSGSFVVAGSGWVRATAVGEASYANRLTSEARRFSLVDSEIRNSINRVLKAITWIIVPVTLLLIWSQTRAHGGLAAALADGTWRSAVTGAVSGIIGMIPEGLVLLTSISFGLAAVTLARRMVLVQELPAVEVLARVDIVCLDKTGTLTEGEIVVESVLAVADRPDLIADRDRALRAVAEDPAANATARALGALAVNGPSPAVAVEYTAPFSSARKWSSLTVDSRHWVLGAPEVMLAGRTDELAGAALAIADAAAHEGRRAVLLALADGPVRAHEPLPVLEPVAVVRLREKVRPDAAETLAYFEDQSVALRIISGDNPVTVAAVAREVGIADAVGYDARGLPEDLDELADVLEEHRVFGRVTPEQKRTIVHALQARGHTVAMTGDGVNDALALKDADLGIAMGSGAGATKAVARLVLMDGRFATLPSVVAEGRRVIANIERVANLFLTKTSYAVLLAVTVAVIGWPYPFEPIQMTLISSLTIGVPGFFLALAPNKRRYQRGFLPRVLSFAIPSGIIAGLATLGVYAWLGALGYSAEVVHAGVTVTLGGIGLCVLAFLARPWAWWRVGLVLAMAAGFILAIGIPFTAQFFDLMWPTGARLWIVAAVIVAGGTSIWLVQRFIAPRIVAHFEPRKEA